MSVVVGLTPSTALAHDIVFFKQERAVAPEAGGSVSLQVDRCCHGAGAASVGWETTTGDPATHGAPPTAPEDYAAGTGRLDFGGPISSSTTTLDVADDAVVEPVEIAQIELSDPQGSPAPIITYPRAGDFVILDDDGPSRLAFMYPHYSTYSNRKSLVVHVVRLGDATGSATVGVDAVDGTALEGTHFRLSTSTVEIPAGRRQGNSVEIEILNPSGERGTTEFTLELSSGPDATAGPHQATVEIRDLDTGDYEKPFTDFHLPRQGATYGRRSYKAKEAHVFADDRAGSGVKTVQLALRRKLDRGGCSWWMGSRWRRGRCGTGAAKWYVTKRPKFQGGGQFNIIKYPGLKPTRGTRIRSYRVISRATDFSRNRESFFRRGFNIRDFKIR